jgi:hypothetical protein
MKMNYYQTPTHETKNCIVCGKTARKYTGHVKDGEEHIIAGFCSYDCMNLCIDEHIFSDELGCFGEYKEAFGKQVIKF